MIGKHLKIKHKKDTLSLNKYLLYKLFNSSRKKEIESTLYFFTSNF